MDAAKALLHRKPSTEQPRRQSNQKEIDRAKRKEENRVRCQQAPTANIPRIPKSAGFSAESFDAVLLDAPCSALGLRPRLHFPHTLEELQGTAQYQRSLMDTAVKLVKPGGTLVYSTCTINPGIVSTQIKICECFPQVRTKQMCDICWITIQNSIFNNRDPGLERQGLSGIIG